MAVWPTTLRLGTDLRLLVTSPEGDDLIKARLPMRPQHPRALLTLLEGVALWSGRPLDVVIFAAAHDGPEPWGDEPWPAESPLVRFDFAAPLARARRTLSGVGDFRSVRRRVDRC